MDTPPWIALSDDQLMETRISALRLTLVGTPLETLIQQLYAELGAKGLLFNPPCFVGDEWFCPIGIPAIFIPFYLTHERLREIERRIMLEVEGETSEWFMQLIRHEAAHAYSYAFRLYRKKKWQACFGLASQEQLDTYRPRPYSHSYVIHLEDWYAQSHPDEDFAETFAVWLTPDLDWRSKYKGWKALQKLEYVDSLMKSLAGKPPLHQPAFNPRDHDCLNVKLKTYYARKRKQSEETYPDFYDRDLRRLFAAAAGDPGVELASHYLKRHRKHIMNSVCHWTPERKYTVSQLLTRLVSRCDQLRLQVHPVTQGLDLNLSAYITALVMNYLFTGKFKRSK